MPSSAAAPLDRPAVQVNEDMALVHAVRRGLGLDAIDDALASGKLSPAELDRLAIPRKTLSHRRSIGRLSADQSDRLLRILRTIAGAERAFGSDAKAARWLRLPTQALGGSAPLDLLDTETGARQVEALLGRIEHGIAA